MEGIFDAKLYTINFPIANADNITQRRGKETSPPPPSISLKFSRSWSIQHICESAINESAT
jgi:hypothetical protein